MVTENIILLIGVMLVAGSIIGMITHSLRITSIVGYIIAGIILGPAFHLVELSPHTMKMIVSFTLALVAFIIGGTFTTNFIKKLVRVHG
jgi:Kef-type K+ transport system membrane component KefB